VCVTVSWAHMSIVHSILSLKLGVTAGRRREDRERELVLVCGWREGGARGVRGREGAVCGGVLFSEKKINSLPSVLDLALGKVFYFIFFLLLYFQNFFNSLPSVLDLSTRQSFFFIFFFTFFSRKKDFISLPSVFLTLDKSSVCRVFFLHSANPFFVECFFFAECFYRSTRQRTYLPSARENTLGKHKTLDKFDIFGSELQNHSASLPVVAHEEFPISAPQGGHRKSIRLSVLAILD